MVTDTEAHIRLDRFLQHHLPGVPISFIHRLLRTGQVRVNKGRVRGGLRLNTGDEVRVPPVRLATPKQTKHPPDHRVYALQKRIVWWDEHFLVFNKSEGMAVHGGSGHAWGVVDMVRRLAQLQESNTPTDHEQNQPSARNMLSGTQPELCHRLDKATSGCLLFALNPLALRQMAEMFRDGKVEKNYLALVRGTPNRQRGVIDAPLSKGVVRSGERMVVSHKDGVAARTHYQMIHRFDNASLMRVTLESGRTHQIRVHFQSIGHPVVGDHKYGDHSFDQRMRKKGLNRLFLHAKSLAFVHPIYGTKIRVEVPLDEKLHQVLQTLNQGGKPLKFTGL